MRNLTALRAVIVGLIALALVVESALLPWSSWLSEDGTEEQLTDLFGPDFFDNLNNSPARSVKMSAADQKKIETSVLIYTIIFPLAFGLWLTPLWVFLRRYVGRLSAVLGVISTSLVLSFCVFWVLAPPAIDWASGQVMTLSSTWTAEFELQNMRLEGPLSLLAGVMLGMAAAFWAVRAHRGSLKVLDS